MADLGFKDQTPKGDSHKVMFQIPDVEQNGNPDVNMN